ncbi:aspartyl-tRNA synthetase, partial [Trifolium medium]|nr:aspartyl-tRNA synthetase [Trifolium medium]
MYSHIIGIDVDLWDIVEEGVKLQNMDADGIISSVYRKALSDEEKELYRKLHKVKTLLTKFMSQSEYLKISNKSSAKSMWDSLCCTYEGNEHVQEAKVNLVVHQYETFKMKEDEDIITMFARFQTITSRLQDVKRSYTVSDHLKKILRSLPSKWKFEVA